MKTGESSGAVRVSRKWRWRAALILLALILTAWGLRRAGRGSARVDHDPDDAPTAALTLLSPVDGILGRFDVGEGQLVTNGQALARIHSAELERNAIDARTAVSEARLDLRYAALLLESLRTSTGREEQRSRMQLSALREQQIEQLDAQRQQAREVATEMDTLQAEVDRGRLDRFDRGPATDGDTLDRRLGQLRARHAILRAEIERREGLLADFVPTSAERSPVNHRLVDVEKSVRLAEESLARREDEWRAAIARRDADAVAVHAPEAGQVLRFLCHDGDAIRQSAPILMLQKLDEAYVRRFLAPR